MINDVAVKAARTGMLIFGGGLVKHHICNANLMRNGAHYAVFVNTGQEFDGSDSVRPPPAHWVDWTVDCSSGGQLTLLVPPATVSASILLVSCFSSPAKTSASCPEATSGSELLFSTSWASDFF